MGTLFKKLSSINQKKLLIFFFALALTVRLVSLMYLPERHRTPSTDTEEYDKLAINLLSGKGFINFTTGRPTAWRVPAYPVFLASIYIVFGHNYTAVRVVQSLMSAFLCVLIFLIAKMLFNRGVAVISALILCFYKPYILYSFFGGPGFLFSENLFTFLLAIFICFILRRFLPRPSAGNNIIAGILLGLMALTRPVAALFPLIVFFLVMYKNKYHFTRTIRQTALLFISFILILLPWTARNYLVFKKFIPFSLEGGFVLFASNNPQVSGSGLTHLDNVLTMQELRDLENMSETEADSIFRAKAKEFFIKHYKKLPRLFLKKLLVFWDLFITDYDIDNKPVRVYNIWYSIIFLFALLGMIKSVRTKVAVGQLFLFSLFVYFSILAMVFCGDPRFRYPLEFCLVIFAAAGVFSIYRFFTNKLISYSLMAGIILAHVFLYNNSGLVLQMARKLL